LKGDLAHNLDLNFRGDRKKDLQESVGDPEESKRAAGGDGDTKGRGDRRDEAVLTRHKEKKKTLTVCGKNFQKNS